MTDNKQKLEGYAESDYGVRPIEIIFENGEFYGCWEAGDLRDDFDSFEDVVDYYQDTYYKSLEDYKANKGLRLVGAIGEVGK